MTDATGWPDASKPGVPLNPERDGWHWVNGSPLLWDQWHKVWKHSDGFECYRTTPSQAAFRGWNYSGSLLTPAEVAAREAAAAEAMREACATIVDAHAAAAKRCSEEGDVIYRIRAEFLANSYAITQAADDVRVTPLPAPDALARALAEARAAGEHDALLQRPDEATLARMIAQAKREGMRGALKAALEVEIPAGATPRIVIAAAIRAAAERITR